MSLKQCVKCGQPVDEAKAFCPYCSHSFDVETERGDVPEFESTSNTDTFSQSFFNEVLSEMDLNISEPPVARVGPIHQEASITSSDDAKGSFWKWIAALITLLLLAAIGLILMIVLR